MQCVSCAIEINPKWKSAIDKNECPFCGEVIMDSKLKNLLSDLRSIMDQLMEFPEELSDWLLSNYNFINPSSEKLVHLLTEDQIKEFIKIKKNGVSLSKFDKKVVKVNNGETEEEVEVVAIQDEEKTIEFAKRAGLTKKTDKFKSFTEKTKHFKNLVEQIKSGRVSSSEENDEEPIDESELNEVLTHDFMNSTSGVKSSMSSVDDEDLPPVIENMLLHNNAPGANQKDIGKLQRLQHKQKSGLQNMLNGSGRFSR